MKAIKSLFRYFKKAIYRVWHWETWHWTIKYFMMLPAWFWYCLRARSFWFFTASNPTLTFGGFEGENKREMYAQLPKGTYPETLYIDWSESFISVEAKVNSRALKFPLAVKPDVGTMGLMFRKIASWAELRLYHEKMKAGYIIQEFVPYPLEVSVFYYRFPGNEKGTITGFVRKEYLMVTGDGKSTLWELICGYPRVQFRLEEMRIKHAENLSKVIPAGELYTLSHALNLSRGGKLVSLEHEKDDQLLKIFDALSHYNGNFYFGRYDIKCESVEDLKHGRNFSILEFNGSGAEAHHVYGNGNTLIEALRILLFHWHILFKISVANHKRGIPYWSFKRGYDHLMKSRLHFQMLRQLEFENPEVEQTQQTEHVYSQRELQVVTNDLSGYSASSNMRAKPHAN
jgi:hypothetical protein